MCWIARMRVSCSKSKIENACLFQFLILKIEIFLGKLLVSTRIKGILEKGMEVELGTVQSHTRLRCLNSVGSLAELLGLQESVELITAVAQLDTDFVPPQLLEICQLCGRYTCI